MHGLGLLDRRLDQPALDGLRYGLHHDEIAQPLQQVDGEPARIVPGLDHLVDGPEQRGTVPGCQGVHRVVDERDLGGPEQTHRARVGDALVPGAGHELIKHAESVSRRSTAGPNDQRKHCRVDVHALLGADPLDQAPHG